MTMVAVEYAAKPVPMTMMSWLGWAVVIRPLSVVRSRFVAGNAVVGRGAGGGGAVGGGGRGRAAPRRRAGESDGQARRRGRDKGGRLLGDGGVRRRREGDRLSQGVHL